MPSLSTITVNSRIQNTTSLQVTASDTPRTCQVPPISLQRSGSTDEEDRPHSRAQAVIHFSDIFAPLLFCLFAFYFLVCGLQGQVKASEEPTTNSYNATPAPPRWRCNPRRSPDGSERPRPEGSPRGRFRLWSPPSQAKSQAVVPEENASRVLPLALWKTSAASAADMASDWPCLGTFCGRKERLHTTRQPRPEQLLELAL